MLSLNSVTLRPFEHRDVDFVTAARNNLAIEAASQQAEPRPVVAAVFEGRLQMGLAAVSSGGEDDIEFVITRADDASGAPLGIAGLYEVDLHNGVAEMGASIVDPSARGLGLGIDTYVTLLQYAFTSLRLNKVCAHIKASNTVANGTAARLGMHPEGVLEQHRWIDGEHVDLCVYGLLRRNWHPGFADWRSWPEPAQAQPRSRAA